MLLNKRTGRNGSENSRRPKPTTELRAIKNDGAAEKLFVGTDGIYKQQFWHFIAFAVVPLVAVASSLLVGDYPTTAEIVAMAVMWFLVGCIGVSVGLHRYYSHRAFSAHRALEWALAVCSAMACQGPIAYWVALHRGHHKFSDKPGDPHSPHGCSEEGEQYLSFLTFWHGHVGWVPRHAIPRPSFFAKDIAKSRVAVACDRYYSAIAVAGVLLPGFACYLIDSSPSSFLGGTVWGGFGRILLVNNVTWAVNSFGHAFGDREHETGDNSHNSFLLAIPSFGEGWHNNHHAHPWSARLGTKWWQLDLGWCVIWLLHRMHLVSGVKSV